MDVHELFTHDLNHLDDRIAALENYASEQGTDNVIHGDQLEVRVLRRQRELLRDLIDHTSDLEGAIAYCRVCLIAAEDRHHKLAENAQTQRLSHADQWWETETEVDYLGDYARKLEAVKHE